MTQTSLPLNLNLSLDLVTQIHMEIVVRDIKEMIILPVSVIYT